MSVFFSNEADAASHFSIGFQSSGLVSLVTSPVDLTENPEEPSVALVAEKCCSSRGPALKEMI